MSTKTLGEIISDESFYKYVEDIGILRTDFFNSKTYFQKLAALKYFYLRNEEKILYRHNRWAFSYPIDWNQLLNHIEMEAWCAIRSAGHVVMYPQYPVLKYFIDFANPGLKIGLEIDGRDFHDKEKDIVRDTELRNIGWIIYRVTGSEMFKVDSKYWDAMDDYYMYDEEKEELKRNHFLHTGEGVIEAIKWIYFLPQYIDDDFECLCQETLNKHTIV